MANIETLEKVCSPIGVDNLDQVCPICDHRYGFHVFQSYVAPLHTVPFVLGCEAGAMQCGCTYALFEDVSSLLQKRVYDDV